MATNYKVNGVELDTLFPSIDTEVNAGDGLTGGGDLSENREISHGDTSSQDSVTNAEMTVIQSVDLDEFGHVTGLTSATLPGRVLLVTGNFTAEAGNTYMVTTADITMPVIAVGEVFEFHAMTDNVRVLNPTYTITNGERSIVAGDDLLLKNGQTAILSVVTETIMEVI